MKRTVLMCVLFIASFCFGAVPDREINLDIQKTDVEWDIKWLFSGTTPLIRGNLFTDSNPWTASSDWSGFLWYGTNSDWEATNTVQIAGTFYTNQTYADFQAGAADFPDDGTFYGGVVMTNDAGRIIEWGLGTIYVRTSGGVGSPGTLATEGSIWAQRAIKGEVAFNSYVSNIVAGANITVGTTGNTSTISADLTNYVATNDAVYLAALTNISDGSGISVTGTARSRQIASTDTLDNVMDRGATADKNMTFNKTDADILKSSANGTLRGFGGTGPLDGAYWIMQGNSGGSDALITAPSGEIRLRTSITTEQLVIGDNVIDFKDNIVSNANMSLLAGSNIDWNGGTEKFDAGTALATDTELTASTNTTLAAAKAYADGTTNALSALAHSTDASPLTGNISESVITNAVDAVFGAPINPASLSDDDVLAYDSASGVWTNQAQSGGGGSITQNQENVELGSGFNVGGLLITNKYGKTVLRSSYDGDTVNPNGPIWIYNSGTTDANTNTSKHLVEASITKKAWSFFLANNAYIDDTDTWIQFNTNYNDTMIELGDEGLGVILHNPTAVNGGNVGEGKSIVARFRSDGNDTVGNNPFTGYRLQLHAPLYGEQIYDAGNTQLFRVEGTTVGRPWIYLRGSEIAEWGYFEESSDFVTGPQWHFRKSRGSLSSRAIAQNGDVPGIIDFESWDGNEWVIGANISAKIIGTPGDDDMPHRLTFNTCSDGSKTLANRLLIMPNGEVIVTNSPGITVTGNVTVADTVFGSGWNASFEVPTKNAIYDRLIDYGVYAWSTQNQTIGTSSWTTNTYTEEDDTYSVFSNDTYIVPIDGFYVVDAQVDWLSADSTKLYMIAVSTNDVRAKRSEQKCAADGVVLPSTISYGRTLPAGTRININLYQNSGGNEEVLSDPGTGVRTSLRIFRL